MTTRVVTDHLGNAQIFLEKSKQYLAEGDLHQASEKGWGAAAHIAKAIAAVHGWQYEIHDHFDIVIYNAREHYRLSWELIDFGNAAHALHRNYYLNSFLLKDEIIERNIESVERLVNALEPYAN